jgi:hypothetical protein
VSESLKKPRAEEEDMGRLYAQLAATRISTLEEKYKLGVNLEDKEGNCFIYRDIYNNPTSYKSIL